MPADEIELEVDESRPGCVVLVIRGEIDVYSAPRVRECLIDLINAGHRSVVVDLDEAGFIDSAGLGVLVAGLKRFRGLDGELSLVCKQRNILKLLEFTGLSSVFRVAASVDEATSV